MQMVRARRESGQLPSHHMFGGFELERDYSVELIIPKLVKYAWINRIGNWCQIEFLDQQLRSLFLLRKCDAIYAPYAATNTKLLVLLKTLGLIRKPLIILVHLPLLGQVSKSPWKRAVAKRLIQQYDRIIFFSNRIRQEIEKGYAFDEAYCQRHFVSSQWGFDMDYFTRFDRTDVAAVPFAISAGNSWRDFDILVRAARRFEFPLKIYCKPESYPRERDIPPHVELLSGEFPYEDICKDQVRAQFILIPILPGAPGMLGYTSLLEALVIGKPVIMTRNLNIDLDIEKAGIGLYVDEGDEDGWYRAIKRMVEEPALRGQMTATIASIDKRELSIDILARTLAKTISGLTDIPR
ncbi:MAG TPA: glycosyltransferase [Chryseolinea sp.]|nr:glycosyltransferase [Chryseolinea sp.]